MRYISSKLLLLLLLLLLLSLLLFSLYLYVYAEPFLTLAVRSKWCPN